MKKTNYELEHEVVFPDDFKSFRWFAHDVPSPLVRWHYHDAFELHYLHATTGTSYVGDYVGKFKPGSFFLIGPNLPHNWVSDLEPGSKNIARDIFVQFKLSQIENLQCLFPEFSSVNEMLKQANNGLEFTGCTAQQAALMLQRLGTLNGATRAVCFLSLLTMLSESNERHTLASARYVQSVQLNDLKKLNRIIEFIYNNFQDALNINDISSDLYMTPSKFSRFFKKNTGMNFVAFVNKVRIDNACLQLSTTKKSIATICYDSGFRNLSNFNRTFLAAKQVTPREYREVHR